MLLTSASCGPSMGVTSNVDLNWEEVLENNSWLPLADLILIYNFHVRVITRKIFLKDITEQSHDCHFLLMG